MRLKTIIDQDFQVYLPALIGLKTNNQDRDYCSILFLIDTGATDTTILGGDAKRLNIDFKKLKKSKNPSLGISGTVDTYEMFDVELVFEEEGTKNMLVEQINKIDVLKPSENKRRRKEPAISLLGTDFLRRLEFKYRMPLIEI